MDSKAVFIVQVWYFDGLKDMSFCKLISLLVLVLAQRCRTAYCSSTAFVTQQPRPDRLSTLSTKEHQHREVDDDDVSQHEYMADQPKKGSYRPIEEWHEEHVTNNPKHVLTQLQQEKANWNKKFENVGGEGI